MADALRAGEQRVHELLRRQRIGVPFTHVLEPLHRVPRSVLQAQHVHRAQRLVVGQHHRNGRARGAVLRELVGQLDRILDGQLGARSDREVCRVHRVAHQHHMTAAVAVPPLLAAHALKVQPRRPAQVPRVGHQRVAAQCAREQLLAECHRRIGVGAVQPMRLPDMLRRLDDERARLVVELVDVRLEPAVFGLLEREGERIPEPLRPEPDEAVGPRDDVRLEDGCVLRADSRVDAVRRDDQVRVRKVRVRVHVLLEAEPHTNILATALQNVQQVLASDADEAMPAAADRASLEIELDVVPMHERVFDRACRLDVAAAHVLERLVREDHAPPERVVRLVPLDDRDVVCRILLLEQQCRVEPSRPATHAHDLHASPRGFET